MSVALSGEQYDIAAGFYHAVVTEVGGALRHLAVDGRDVLDGCDADQPCLGAEGNLLIPWPNRVDHGRYGFDGQRYQLDINEPDRDTALHGLVRFAAWRPVEHERHRLRLAHRLHGPTGYPFVLDLAVEYALDPGAGLTVRMSATNVGSRRAPYGQGAHPYLTVGLPCVDDCLLTLPASVRLRKDARELPTGHEAVEGTPYDFRTARQVGEMAIDHTFTDLARDPDGRAWAHLRSPGGATVSLWADETFGWFQAFTGDTLPCPQRRRAALAVEPMSCAPNAFVTGTGLLSLRPGESTDGTWGVAVADR
ncbi:MAG: aldose 1-epimerase family protein [Streptosporangiaceae bacterium]